MGGFLTEKVLRYAEISLLSKKISKMLPAQASN